MFYLSESTAFGGNPLDALRAPQTILKSVIACFCNAILATLLPTQGAVTLRDLMVVGRTYSLMSLGAHVD